MSQPLILAYHGIADVEARYDPVRLFVSPARFRSQVRSLIRRDYRFLHMAELAQCLRAGDNLSGTCTLTFDDGTADNAAILAPMLREFGIPATLYICSGLLGSPYPWGGEVGVRFMTGEEVLELSRDPLVEIGSHTSFHTELDNASFEVAYREMARSKYELEELIGHEVKSFAYPRDKLSPACPAAAERAGYTSAVTTGGRGHGPFELSRQAVRGHDGRVAFALKLAGRYETLSDLGPVRAARSLRRLQLRRRRPASGW
jgi:peptidoglycan/xylan/chitin deacetylase (PgdA/CDA1 family)